MARKTSGKKSGDGSPPPAGGPVASSKRQPGIADVIVAAITQVGAVSIKLVAGLTNTVSLCVLILSVSGLSAFYIYLLPPQDRVNLSSLRGLVQDVGACATSGILPTFLVVVALVEFLLLVTLVPYLHYRCQRLGDENTNLRNQLDPERVRSGDPATWKNFAKMTAGAEVTQ